MKRDGNHSEVAGSRMLALEVFSFQSASWLVAECGMHSPTVSFTTCALRIDYSIRMYGSDSI